jgi:HD-GYP domain-containing protein (c-di-GMP phosphodiesterase class II)
VVAVVDAYDAMTSQRPYRRAMPHEVALAQLLEHRGAQFCPRCVEAFEAVLALETLATAEALVTNGSRRSTL